MDEIVVRLCRVIACTERLRVLSHLVTAGETSPTELARQLRLSPTALSAHLAKLSAVGLIKRRRSAGWSYCVAESPYGETTLSGRTSRWLRGLLGKPERVMADIELGSAGYSRTDDAQKQLHALLFEAATAFTDLRRLQLLRYLAGGEVASVQTLCQRLHMSPWALSRHTEKLIRRGYLVVQRDTRHLLYRIAEKSQTPIHAALWEIVWSSWQRNKLRTS